MIVSKAAHRYAKALLELAEEQNNVEQTLKDIVFIKNTIEGSRDLLVFLKSPIIKPDKKVAALKEIFTDHLSELVNRFILLVARKNRQNMIDEIVTAFIDEYNKYAGIISAEVYSAYELNEKQLDELTKQLERTTNKKVNISTFIQPELKGGLAVKIDDTVIDGTVKHKLEQLEESFLQAATE